MNILSSLINYIVFHSGSLLGSVFLNDYLKKARNGKKTSEKILQKIIRKNKDTEYGRKYGFSKIKTIDDFRNSVSLSTYDDYKEYIDQMRLQGRQNLITSKRITDFTTTSGTTSRKKYIPQFASSSVPFLKGVCIFVNQCVRALHQRKVSFAYVRGFLVTEVTDAYEKKDDNGSVGYFSQYSISATKAFMPMFTQIPKDAIGCGEIEDREYFKCRWALQEKDLKFIVATFMSLVTFSIGYIEKNHNMLIEDIEKGTINPNVKMSESIRKKLQSTLKPDPERAAELRDIFNNPDERPLVSRIWPEMSYITAIGSADFEPFTKTMIKFCDDDVVFNNSFYACSESIIGCAVYFNDPRYLLIPDAAFYEFIPVDSDNRDKTLLMHELEEGKLYEIIITTFAGLYRYQLKDVIRVVGFEGETPLIEFAYRANHVTDICNTHVTGEDLSFCIKKLEDDYQIHVSDYSIYANPDYTKPRIEFFIECTQEINDQDREKMEASLEEYLDLHNWEYGDNRRVNFLYPVKMYIVKKDTYYNYRKLVLSNGSSSNQLKAMRLIDTEEKLNFLKDNLI